MTFEPTQHLSTIARSANVDAPLLQPLVPGWVARAIPRPRNHVVANGISATSGDSLTLLSISVPDTERLNVAELRDAVTDAYTRLGEALERDGLSGIRMWNYMPDPTHRMSDGLDRYMVFNEGRSAGYQRWFGAGHDVAIPTATAVGIHSSELVVHCLASPERGRPVENPRQTPSWRYSHRYGPTPPRFSRATVAGVANKRLILIGGTASIVGEDTVHAGDLERQTDETLANLAALIAAACVEHDMSGVLARLQDVRVYVTAPHHAIAVRDVLACRCPQLSNIEFATTRLCRPELLVEIEGVAGLNPPG